MDICDFLAEDTELIESSLGDATVTHPTVIKVDTAYCKLIQLDREISLAAEKRFKGKHTLYGSPGYKDLVSWCLSTNGYAVSSGRLNSVSDDDVSLVWQFIDTMSVSSTERCRELINRGKGSRSGVGFSRCVSGKTKQPRNSKRERVGAKLRRPPTIVPFGDQNASEHDTVEHHITEDCMHWILSSPDPMGSYTALRDSLSNRHQGI